jgi:hypothetical protein
VTLLTATLALATLLQDQAESVNFSTIDKGTTSGFQAPLQMYVVSEKEWIDLWEKRQGSGAPQRTHPAVDFSRDVVVVAALGSKLTGGYSLEVSKIVRTKENIEVTVRIGSPAPGSTPRAGSTSPFVLVRMRKPDKPVTFKEEEKK